MHVYVYMYNVCMIAQYTIIMLIVSYRIYDICMYVYVCVIWLYICMYDLVVYMYVCVTVSEGPHDGIVLVDADTVAEESIRAYRTI